MRTISLPGSGLTASNVILGLMRIADMSDADIRTLFHSALDAGITMVDHADIYGGISDDGPRHFCEQRFGDAVHLTSSQREHLVIQTKCGINRGYYDSSYVHIVESVEASLRALGTDHIDVLLLHRPDTLVEPEEVARAFDQLASTGKVLSFGVSNHTPGQIELLRRYLTQPIVVNQMQLSITHAPMISQGLAANMGNLDQSVSRDLGVLDYCRLHEITLQAWSPIGSGFFPGTFLGSPEYPELNAVLDRLAAKYQVTPLAIATAWITRHPARIQVVLGTTRPDRVVAAALGSELPLTRPEWYELYRAAGHSLP